MCARQVCYILACYILAAAAFHGRRKQVNAAGRMSGRFLQSDRMKRSGEICIV